MIGGVGRMMGHSGSGSLRHSLGGPFALLFDGVSKTLLFNATDRLLLRGADPVAANSGQPIGLLLALTNP